MTLETMISNGLEDVVAAATRLSHVDGEAGELIIAGYPVGELAANATFEETTWLLWHGERPSARELDTFRAELAAHRNYLEALARESKAGCLWLALEQEAATQREPEVAVPA